MDNKIERDKAVELKKAIRELFEKYKVKLTEENLLLILSVSKSASPPLITEK